MLRHTFSHLPGIGPKSESSLWEAGIRTWEDFLSAPCPPVSPAKAALMRQGLLHSKTALEARDASWFASRLRGAGAWRLFPFFLDQAGSFDIETDGEPHPTVTAASLLSQGRLTTYVHGRNMDELEEDLARVEVLVTFNGKCFDAPIVERVLGFQCPRAHVDLRFVLRAIGVSGGLKACEKRYGLCRGGLDGVDGWDAVLLWREWERTGDMRVLETLLAYNAADVLSLGTLLAHALDDLMRATPFAGALTIPVPRTPANPFLPDRDVVARIKRAPQRFRTGGAIS